MEVRVVMEELMGVATKFTTFSDILSAGKTPFALQAILKDLVIRN